MNEIRILIGINFESNLSNLKQCVSCHNYGHSRSSFHLCPLNKKNLKISHTPMVESNQIINSKIQKTSLIKMSFELVFTSFI